MHLPNITIAALLVGMSAFAVPSMSAAQDTPAIDQRQARQSQRIANGQASGKLSNREAARLQAGQAKVANMEANAKADGKVSRDEISLAEQMATLRAQSAPPSNTSKTSKAGT